METLAFNEYPIKRIADCGWYEESDKWLSFAYRDENLKSDDGLRAFIALKHENAPIEVEGNGCKIMGYYIREKDEEGHLFADNSVLQEELFRHAIMTAIIWVIDGKEHFHYYWFVLSEETKPLYELMENPQREGDIIYSIIKRKR